MGSLSGYRPVGEISKWLRASGGRQERTHESGALRQAELRALLRLVHKVGDKARKLTELDGCSRHVKDQVLLKAVKRHVNEQARATGSGVLVAARDAGMQVPRDARRLFVGEGVDLKVLGRDPHERPLVDSIPAIGRIHEC